MFGNNTGVPQGGYPKWGLPSGVSQGLSQKWGEQRRIPQAWSPPRVVNKGDTHRGSPRGFSKWGSPSWFQMCVP
jgi:hypothetical protein